MEDGIVKMMKKCGGYVASRRGVYVYDEDEKVIKYIDKAKIDTPEEDSSWKIVYYEKPLVSTRAQMAVKRKPTSFRLVNNEDDYLDNLLFMLKKAGGYFDTKRYHYELDMRSHLILRMDVKLYYSELSTPKDWEILGAFEVTR